MAKRRSQPCPCGRPATYAECCGRLHRGEAQAATAEDLMRSRYSAFVMNDAAYVLASWHPSTRPARLDLERAVRWEGLDILRTEGGSPFHTEGTVEFRARHRHGELHEVSRFVRDQGTWVYLDGSVEGRA